MINIDNYYEYKGTNCLAADISEEDDAYNVNKTQEDDEEKNARCSIIIR